MGRVQENHGITQQSRARHNGAITIPGKVTTTWKKGLCGESHLKGKSELQLRDPPACCNVAGRSQDSEYALTCSPSPAPAWTPHGWAPWEREQVNPLMWFIQDCGCRQFTHLGRRGHAMYSEGQMGGALRTRLSHDNEQTPSESSR